MIPPAAAFQQLQFLIVSEMFLYCTMAHNICNVAIHYFTQN
jgi:hypothetical protein